MAPRVDLDEDLPVAAANVLVVRRFDATQPDIVDANVAEQVRRQILLRVVATALLEEPDAGKAERSNAVRHVGRHLAPHVHERFLPAQALDERVPIARRAVAERAAERGGDTVRVGDFSRDRVNRLGVDAVGEHAALPIEKLATFGGRLDRPVLLPHGARHEVRVLDDLEVDEARLDAGRPEAEEDRRDDHPPSHGPAPSRGKRIGVRTARIVRGSVTPSESPSRAVSQPLLRHRALPTVTPRRTSPAARPARPVR